MSPNESVVTPSMILRRWSFHYLLFVLYFWKDKNNSERFYCWDDVLSQHVAPNAGNKCNNLVFYSPYQAQCACLQLCWHTSNPQHTLAHQSSRLWDKLLIRATHKQSHHKTYNQKCTLLMSMCSTQRGPGKLKLIRLDIIFITNVFMKCEVFIFSNLLCGIFEACEQWSCVLN